jgi:hypothetical protein
VLGRNVLTNQRFTEFYRIAEIYDRKVGIFTDMEANFCADFAAIKS